MGSDIVRAAVFLDYEPSDYRGRHRRPSELQGGDPLVLVLARGGFCPKDRRQHKGLLQLHCEMHVGCSSRDNLDRQSGRAEPNDGGVGARFAFSIPYVAEA
jgi:hypothetical protein